MLSVSCVLTILAEWKKSLRESSTICAAATGEISLTKILLIRHGHVEGIEPKRFRGRAGVPLTALGLAQAQAVARRVASRWQPVKVYTSPLERAVTTGAAIAEACGVGTEVVDTLIDIDYGAWQGKTEAEVSASEPTLFAAWHDTPQLVRFPGGEALQDLVARAADALRDTLARHPDETAVLVAHDSVNRTLLLQLLDQPLSTYWRLVQSPCCINEIDVKEGCIEVLRVNETAHLDELAGA
ncbi:MAG TPA: histidine phosphatase family protein [Xanthobacteraceae bacterium]|nr:histidine phosphatase family protein [Xanthobacteraceae bacterium]